MFDLSAAVRLFARALPPLLLPSLERATACSFFSGIPRSIPWSSKHGQLSGTSQGLKGAGGTGKASTNRAWETLDMLCLSAVQRSQKMADLGRLGGLKGGKARALSLSRKQRSHIARNAANVRWEKDLLKHPRVARRRLADKIAAKYDVDAGDVEHVLFNMTMAPLEKLQRSMQRARLRGIAYHGEPEGEMLVNPLDTSVETETANEVSMKLDMTEIQLAALMKLDRKKLRIELTRMLREGELGDYEHNGLVADWLYYRTAVADWAATSSRSPEEAPPPTEPSDLP